MNILRIDSATSEERSISRKLTQAITDHFRAKHPEAVVTERDFGTAPLPHITPVTTGAIRLPFDQQTPEMQAAFPAERAVLEQFLAADVVIIGAPMYNFTIPSSLKAWIDRLGVAGVTFRYTEAGPEGLAGGRRVIFASTSGGEYQLDAPFEHHNSYLRDVFAFLGITDPTFICAEKTGYGPEAVEAALAAAQVKIDAL